ncbi:MAG: ferrochelatase [Deltaproteobacteria bacterium]|nr:ferrochelatase [Deltaproteobacteria bacterium]
MKKGIWLIQLGTPEAPTEKACRKFLKEFLMDAKVIDIPFLFRWFLVHFIIIPFRVKRVAIAYQSIWTSLGSPLRVFTERLIKKLEIRLSSHALVLLSMRYGRPSIPEIAKKFIDADVEEILVLPLYPQYADSSTGTALELVRATLPSKIKLKIIYSFYDKDFYIRSVAKTAESISFEKYDGILMSFHGLPERQIKKIDLNQSHCLKKNDCCEQNLKENQFCYRHHSVVTTQKLVKALNLPVEKVHLCFQSRLGRTPWIRPFTDEVIVDLAKKGAKRLLVFCPSFVADCLETLEEIQIRNKELFIENGGEDLVLVPSLNDSDFWAESLSQFLLDELSSNR